MIQMHPEYKMPEGHILMSSEQISPGHPDKVADYIADSILTEMTKQDPYTRAGIEVQVSTQRVCVAGEVTTRATYDLDAIIRKAIRDIGYFETDSEYCKFDADKVEIISNLVHQSADIALGVDEKTVDSDDTGAGDQG